MKTGIAFAAVPKDRAGITSTLSMSSIAAFAGAGMLYQTFGVTGLLVTGLTGVLSTSTVGITGSMKRKKTQRAAINAVLADVLHSDVRISKDQTRRLLSGQPISFRQGDAETLEITYLSASGEVTAKPGRQEDYTGLISIDCHRDPFDGVQSFDSILKSLSEQNAPQVLNAAQRKLVQKHLEDSSKKDENSSFGTDEWHEQAASEVLSELKAAAAKEIQRKRKGFKSIAS